MSERLEDQIRRQTEAMYDEAPPIGSLLPTDMAEQFGLTEEETARESVALRPRSDERRLPRWAVAAVVAALVLLVFTPITLWLPDTSRDTAGLAGVRITGQGTMGPISSGEIVMFTVAASGDGESVSGQVTLRTVEPGAFGHWSIEGEVECIQSVALSEGEFLELRYKMIRSDFPVNHPGDEPSPAGLPGAYASFYVMDSPNGDRAGEATGITEDFADPECGSRGTDIPVFSLLSGDIDVEEPSA